MTAPLELAAPATKAKPRRGRGRTVPVCAACGKRLRSPRHALTPDGLSYTSIDAWRYAKARLKEPAAPPLTFDGAEPTRGDYGCGLVCGQRCGHALAVRLVAAVPGVLDLLPEQWRHRR